MVVLSYFICGLDNKHVFLSPLSMHCYFMMPMFRYSMDKIVRFLSVSEHLTCIIDLI